MIFLFQTDQSVSLLQKTLVDMKNTRERILDAAIHVFSNKGYHNARVDEIVEISETSKGAVYFHFPSKQEIFLGLVEEFSKLLENQIAAAMEKEQSGVLKVEAALLACMQTFGNYQQLAKIFLIQALGLGTLFEEKRQEINNRFIGIIKRHLDQAVEEGDIQKIDTEMAAIVWMGAINEVVIRWVYTGEPPLDRSFSALRTLLLRSIGVPGKQSLNG
jgi:AcrR family transcriptional regulator